MKKIIIILTIFFSGCSTILTKPDSYKVDFYGEGKTQEILLDGVGPKEALKAIEAFLESYINDPLDAPNIDGAVVSKQCSDQGLVYHVQVGKTKRSFLKECWESKCRVVYSPYPGYCINIEE